MKNHLLLTVTALAAATGAIVFSPVLSADVPETAPAAQDQAVQKGAGIAISVSGSAIVSTQGMEPGSEIWAEWYSLPAGQAVTEAAGTAKWAYMEMVLDGSAMVSGDPAPMCSAMGVTAGGADRATGSGDVEVCNYSLFPGARTENGGTEPFVFAGLSVGGPWKPGMEDTAKLYERVKGLGEAAQVSAEQFGELEKELLKAGQMQLSIRRVILPPGGQLVAADRYPTLRMVEKGALSVTTPAEGSSAPEAEVLEAFEMMQWEPAAAEKQVTLSNSGDEPVQFVEWNVAPVQGALP